MLINRVLRDIGVEERMPSASYRMPGPFHKVGRAANPSYIIPMVAEESENTERESRRAF